MVLTTGGGQGMGGGRHFKPFDHRKMNPMADIQVTIIVFNYLKKKYSHKGNLNIKEVFIQTYLISGKSIRSRITLRFISKGKRRIIIISICLFV